MDLYLIRHADALPLGDGAVTDAERPLSEMGQAQATALPVGLQRRGVNLRHVLTSPLLRARQTAEALTQHWSGEAPALSVCDELAPGLRPKKLSRALREFGDAPLAIVGHMPDLAEYTAWLIGARRARLDLAKAGVALVRCEESPGKGSGELVWLITPEWNS